MRRMRLLALLVLVLLGAVGTAVAANHNFATHLSSREEVPPVGVVIDSRAQGQAIFHLSEDGSALEYKLIASNIENVVQAHIHLGPVGENGPIVAFLYGLAPSGAGRTDGVLSEGTITAANLIGPLAGHPLSDLIAAIESGNAYVNIHTNDGVAPTNTGPGDFPGGEIRGQLP
jgi:CHRD domain